MDIQGKVKCSNCDKHEWLPVQSKIVQEPSACSCCSEEPEVVFHVELRGTWVSDHGINPDQYAEFFCSQECFDAAEKEARKPYVYSEQQKQWLK